MSECRNLGCLMGNFKKKSMVAHEILPQECGPN